MGKAAKEVPMHSIKTKEMGSLGFSVIDLSENSGRSYDSNIPHRHTFFEVMFFLSGGGSHEIDFSSFIIEPNSIHFVSPGQIHQLNPKNTKGYVVCFREDFISLNSREDFTERFPYYDDPSIPFIKLKKEQAQEINSLVELVIKDIASTKNTQADLYRSYLNIILLKLNDIYLSSKPYRTGEQNRNAKVQQFKKLVNQNFSENKSPSIYAQELNVSPNHLNALCKKHEGKTAIQLIHERMLLESKRLLFATDLHIKEISFQLGFEDVAYFNRFFKKLSKLTPQEYRKHQLANNR